MEAGTSQGRIGNQGAMLVTSMWDQVCHWFPVAANHDTGAIPFHRRHEVGEVCFGVIDVD